MNQLKIMTAAALLCVMHGPVCAETTIYGVLDAGVDRVKRSEGNVQGTVMARDPSTGAPRSNSQATPAYSTWRISPSLSRTSHIGFKSLEDLGGGYRVGIQLEAGLAPDTGVSVNDGRLFGRRAHIGLTTPLGELRLGRQPSVMLTGFSMLTTESLGATDAMAMPMMQHNLQLYQDNMVSLAGAHGAWRGMLTYSPNAGVAERISSARAGAVAGMPAANPAIGQILGGATAGAETSERRGEAAGGLLA